MSRLEKATDTTAGWFDERLGASRYVRKSLNKVFPDHWSFMLGEIALYSFIILLLTGTYLSFFYTPSLSEVVYDGSYIPLKGVTMSQAYESTLFISFDVRGGLIMRQIHHWAALLFLASIVVHLLRVFFTGAFRKPRELNWVIGVLLLLLGIIEGFAGYSLPDDLLSGTGARIGNGIALSIPVIGTWASFIIFGGEYPGTELLDRLYALHIFVIPLVILGLITFHMLMIWYQKHTQFAGPGRTEDNVVGSRLFPAYAAKAGGFFFLVFAVLAALGGLAQINPIWLYGPYNASQVTAGSQPDWYMGFLDGSTRLMPAWEISALGYTVPLNVLLPTIIMPGLIFTAMALYPWLESRRTGDKGYHNILDRPRDVPVRTGIGAASLAFYGVLVLAGGNDVLANIFQVSVNATTYVGRAALILLPPIAYVVAKRWCIALQRSDEELVHHGIESGTIRRLPSGEFVEETLPLPRVYQLALGQVESEPQDHHSPAPDGPGFEKKPALEKAPDKDGFFRPRRSVSSSGSSNGSSDGSSNGKANGKANGKRPEAELPVLEQSGKPKPPT